MSRGGQRRYPLRADHDCSFGTAEEISPRDSPDASRAARTAIGVTSEHETAIRDVAAGVAAPALIAFVIWMQDQSRQRGLRRLRFLSRDGQVIYELTRRLAPLPGTGLDLEYVYSSRLTWSLAATQPGRLAEAPWLFNSFVKSNAADVCARLGLPLPQCRPAMRACGVSLDPEARADRPAQAQALRRFVSTPEVARAADSADRRDAPSGPGLCEPAPSRRSRHRAGRYRLDRSDGRLAHSGVRGGRHEPAQRAVLGSRAAPGDWLDRPRTGRRLHVQHRDRARAAMAGTQRPIRHGDLLHGRPRHRIRLPRRRCRADTNPCSCHPETRRQKHGGSGCTGRRCTHFARRSPLTAACPATTYVRWSTRSWTPSGATPAQAEARAWGTYPYDSDPAGTAARPLARPFTTRGSAHPRRPCVACRITCPEHTRDPGRVPALRAG